MEAEAAKYIGAGLAALGVGLAAQGVGNIFANFLQGAFRNPSAQPKLNASLIFGFAVTEALGIFAFLVALLLMFAL